MSAELITLQLAADAIDALWTRIPGRGEVVADHMPRAMIEKTQEARRAIAAALSAQARASEAEDAPEGWQLVPIEPTQEMMEADWNVTLSDAHTDGGVGRCAWAAMLAAAPARRGET